MNSYAPESVLLEFYCSSQVAQESIIIYNPRETRKEQAVFFYVPRNVERDVQRARIMYMRDLDLTFLGHFYGKLTQGLSTARKCPSNKEKFRELITLCSHNRIKFVWHLDYAFLIFVEKHFERERLCASKFQIIELLSLKTSSHLCNFRPGVWFYHTYYLQYQFRIT